MNSIYTKFLNNINSFTKSINNDKNSSYDNNINNDIK